MTIPLLSTMRSALAMRRKRHREARASKAPAPVWFASTVMFDEHTLLDIGLGDGVYRRCRPDPLD
jgi:hypothetical protein